MGVPLLQRHGRRERREAGLLLRSDDVVVRMGTSTPRPHFLPASSLGWLTSTLMILVLIPSTDPHTSSTHLIYHPLENIFPIVSSPLPFPKLRCGTPSSCLNHSKPLHQKPLLLLVTRNRVDQRRHSEATRTCRRHRSTTKAMNHGPCHSLDGGDDKTRDSDRGLKANPKPEMPLLSPWLRSARTTSLSHNNKP